MYYESLQPGLLILTSTMSETVMCLIRNIVIFIEVVSYGKNISRSDVTWFKPQVLELYGALW